MSHLHEADVYLYSLSFTRKLCYPKMIHHVTTTTDATLYQ